MDMMRVKERLELVQRWSGNVLNLIERGVEGESFDDLADLEQAIAGEFDIAEERVYAALKAMFDAGFILRP